MAVAGTIASGALALKFGLDVRDINQQLDQYRRFNCSSPTGLCDSQGQPAQPLTPDQKSTVASKTDTGNRDQTLQWVFVGVGGAFAVAGGYLLYKGYLASEGGQHKVPRITACGFSPQPPLRRAESWRSSIFSGLSFRIGSWVRLAYRGEPEDFDRDRQPH